MNKVLCVLGMHRSGTSLTARWLSEIGLNMGYRQMSGGVGNEDGHFEDLDFCDLHEEIFRENSISYGGFIDKQIHLNDYHSKKISFIMEFKNSLNVQWGWKDPRTCLFIDQYNKVAQASNINVKYLILFREYDMVVDSLVRRDLNNLEGDIKSLRFIDRLKFKILNEQKYRHYIESKAGIYLSAWNFYNTQLLKLINNVAQEDYVLCHYKDFVENSEGLIDVLKHWDFDLVTPVSVKSLYDPKKIRKEANPNAKGERGLYNKSSEEILKALKSSSNLLIRSKRASVRL